MLEMFSRISLLKDLDPKQLSLLEPFFELYTCPPDTIIFEQGDRAAYLYLILRGSVQILYKPHDGPPISVTRLKEGDVFGWSAAIGGAVYTSGMQSLQTVEALRIRGEDLKQLWVQHPETGGILLDRFAQAVSSRWKNADEQVKSMLKRAMDTAVQTSGN